MILILEGLRGSAGGSDMRGGISCRDMHILYYGDIVWTWKKWDITGI